MDELAKKNVRFEDDEARWRELMIAAQAGDSVAYNQLLEELCACVKAYANRFLKGWGNVDDCVQECLISIHNARHTYDPDRAFRPWLFAIARNKITDNFRKHSRLKTKETNTFDEAFHGQTSPDQDRVDTQKDLKFLLLQLDPKFREPLCLTKLEGLSIKEVSQSLNISESLVKVRVFRGLNMLKKLVAKEIE